MKAENHSRRLIRDCPVCDGELRISRLKCEACETQIDSSIAVPSFMSLPADLLEFALTFLRCRGSIKDVEKALGISYPTVCKRLDAVNEILQASNTHTVNGRRLNRRTILEQLESGRISVREATNLLKEATS